MIGEHIRLALRLAAGGARVRGDPAQIQQALINLVLNSHDAMPDGGDLTIATERGKQGLAASECVVLTVTDTGCGMNAATAERVFEPFFTTKPPGEGAGLGLAVVESVIAAHGGTVEVASEPGDGTRVTIRLPLAAPVSG